MAEGTDPSILDREIRTPPLMKAVIRIFLVLLLAVIIAAAIAVIGAFLLPSIYNLDFAETKEEIRTTDWSKYNPFTWYEEFTQKQIAIAKGDIYTGKVDQQTNKPLGVRARELRSFSSTYGPDEDIIVFSTIDALSLSEESITVNIDCRSSKGPVAQEYIPSNTLEILGRQTENIDCVFPPNPSHELGAHVITMTIDFDFSTYAYLPTFFASRDLMRELARTKKSFFSTYAKGYSKNQQSISTAGPILLAMGFGEQPISLDIENPDRTYILGISVQNKWNGNIKEIKDMTLITPKGFKLSSKRGITGASQEKPPEKITCEQLDAKNSAGCNDERQNIYKIHLNPEKIKDFKNYRAYLVADNPDSILSRAPYVQTTFKVIANYEYQFEKKKTITVKLSDEQLRQERGG